LGQRIVCKQGLFFVFVFVFVFLVLIDKGLFREQVLVDKLGIERRDLDCALPRFHDNNLRARLFRLSYIDAVAGVVPVSEKVPRPPREGWVSSKPIRVSNIRLTSPVKLSQPRIEGARLG